MSGVRLSGGMASIGGGGGVAFLTTLICGVGGGLREGEKGKSCVTM